MRPSRRKHRRRREKDKLDADQGQSSPIRSQGGAKLPGWLFSNPFPPLILTPVSIGGRHGKTYILLLLVLDTTLLTVQVRI